MVVITRWCAYRAWGNTEATTEIVDLNQRLRRVYDSDGLVYRVAAL